jgi:hypothetical protein
MFVRAIIYYNIFTQRRDFKDSSETTLFPLSEIWMPVQAEVRQGKYRALI